MSRLVRLWFASTLVIASSTALWASAQSSDDSWAVPLNLSHSGAATNPAIVIDSNGVLHAVWQDDLASYMYTRFDGNQWSVPQPTNLHLLFGVPTSRSAGSQASLSTGPNPLFIAGPGPYIFAFWITSESALYMSRVLNPDFANGEAWEDAKLLSPSAAAFAATVDARGELHVAYLRTVDDPANPPGIYYTGSKNDGENWAVPGRLYESPYLRRLGEGEANLSLVTAGTADAIHVYIAWDNRPRKQVLLAQSADGGASWAQPGLVAGPAPDSGLASPFNIHVGANQNSVVLVWQSGRPGAACTQFYRSSSDAGATWSDPEPMLDDLSSCAQSNEFVTGLANGSEGPLYLLTETQSQTFLTAWNGLQWSQLEEQPILAGFEDPEIFRQVDYGCHRASLLGERLYIIGCDQGEGGDVWVTSRDLGSTTSRFSSPLWSKLSAVTSDTLKMEALELVTTDDGSIHAFFSQYQDPAIYHASWDGESWSNITAVLKLPDGEAAWPAIAAAPGDELFLIARSNRGTVYLSRAISGSAVTASSWSTPTQLEIGHDGELGSVDIAWDAAGKVYLAYSVPVNEERGIYLVQSKDHGTTWSEPLQVFDGAEAGFDLVGAPSLLISENGFLHIIWKQQSIQGDGVPQSLALYYTRSEDGGHTFDDAERVVEEPVAWREIVTDGEGNLHLLWQPQDTPTTVWDQVSLDGGHTWQYPQGLPDEGSLVAVTSDPGGRVHLVGVGPGALGHWLWDGSRWESEAPLSWPLSSRQVSPAELLAAAVNKEGKMMVVLAQSTGEGNVAEKNLLYSTRALELPAEVSANREVSTEETLSSPTITAATSAPERLLTPTASVEDGSTNQGQMEPVETNDRMSPFAVALLPVALLLLSVMGFVIRQAARGKDR